MFKQSSSILIKNTKIHSVERTAADQKMDIFIQDGVIKQIGAALSEDAEIIIDAPSNALAGFCDIGAIAGEPGLDQNETLESMNQTAMAGGFTRIALLSNHAMPFDERSKLDEIKYRSAQMGIPAQGIGCITKGAKGQQMAELMEMKDACGGLYSDGYHAPFESGVFLRALNYGAPNKLWISCIPASYELYPDGQMHEGKVSTTLGLVGMPSMAEVMQVQKAIELAQYAEGQLYLHGISAAASVRLVQEAKAAGVKLMCSTPALNLLLTDADVADFNVPAKLLPPLRSSEDQQALKDGLEKGIIDFVISNHMPVRPEDKELDFVASAFGSIQLQNQLATVKQAFGRLDAPLLHRILIEGPRKLIHQAVPKIAVGAAADLVLWTEEQADLRFDKSYSKSRNNALAGNEMNLSVLATIYKKNVYLNKI